MSSNTSQYLAKTTNAHSNTDGRVSSSHQVRYPFAAIVGHRAAKHALLLLAIDAELRGALIASDSGSTIATLVRAFGSLLPTQPPDFAASPADCASDPELGPDVVEVPLNITEDRLLGGLDLEQTIATGKRHMSAGILARAHRRVLFASDINLLDSSASAHVARALDSRHVRVEREGLSAIHEADFIFVGTFSSDEGATNSLLRDRVGLIVDSASDVSAHEKAEIIKRAIRFDRNPFSFVEGFAFETAQLGSNIEDARARLPRVRVSKDQMRQISEVAMRLGVEGNRADLLALRAARANAALAGRNSVTDDDLIAAIQLVLAPRATTLPSPKEEREEPSHTSQPEGLEESNRNEADDRDRDSIPGAVEDVTIQAIDALVPNNLLSPPQPAARTARSGKRFKASTSIRGRYLRSVIQRPLEARIAIDATLRAAAPFQLSRRTRDELKRKELAGEEVLNERAPTASIRRLKIEPGDLRFKEFKHRSGILFIFAVDASGSMAFNRMAQAKGALTRLLQQAYRHRDKVALISFRGEAAKSLLAPTRSVELGKRLVDAMPAGGGTPLSAGIAKAIELARFARLRGMSQAMLVLFTDGRANVRLSERSPSGAASTIGAELRQLGALLESEEIGSVVVDTKSRFVSSGEGEAWRECLGPATSISRVPTRRRSTMQSPP